jgi:hypothetical protein
MNMKRFLLSCLFLALSLTMALAQTPDQKAEYLTNEMNSLLSLSTEQEKQVSKINTKRFYMQAELLEELYQSAVYIEAVAANFQSEKSQNLLDKIESVKTQKEAIYDAALKNAITNSQYLIFIENKNALLQGVVNEFGE